MICRTNISLSVTLLVSDFQEILNSVIWPSWPCSGSWENQWDGDAVLPAPCSAVGFIILTSFVLGFSYKLFSFPSVEGLIMVVFTGRCVWEPCNLERPSEIYWGLNQNSQDRYNLSASCQQRVWWVLGVVICCLLYSQLLLQDTVTGYLIWKYNIYHAMPPIIIYCWTLLQNWPSLEVPRSVFWPCLVNKCVD